MYEKLYKTSEFAKLCSVSKHTLFHYDDIDLLKPSLRMENGYRYYSIEAYKKFCLIATLTEMGVSLSDIKKYLTSMDENEFLYIMKQKLSETEKLIKHIERIKYILSDTIRSIENKAELAAESDSICYISMDAEQLIATETHLHDNHTHDQMLKDIRDHLDYVSDNDIPTALHMGEIILKKDIDNGDLTESYYYSVAASGNTDPHMLIKPAGIYAVRLYRGNVYKITDFYREMLYEIAADNYEVIGNLYELDLIDHKFEINDDNYLSRVAIHVQKK